MHGLNFRMNEFTAALGVVQVERLDEIVAWKNEQARLHIDPLYPARLELPDGMISGLYKVIVFEPVERVDRQGLRRALPPRARPRGRPADHRLGGGEPLVRAALLPRGRGGARHESPRHRRRRVHRLARRRPAAGAGHEPRIFDLVASPYHSPSEVETVLGDLCDARRGSPRPSTGCDAVAAPRRDRRRRPGGARPGPRRPRERPRHAVLLEAARDADVARFVYASTIWVYGDATGPEALDEDTPLALPKHFYTATKIAGEMYTASYGELYGLEHSILRFGIPYGPRARPAAVVAAFTAKALAGQPLTIAGDGTQSRRFVYVEDLADGVVASLAPAGANRVYNLVGHENVERARDRAHRPRRRRRRADRARRRPGRRPARRQHLGRAGRARARLGGRRRASPTACAATSTG